MEGGMAYGLAAVVSFWFDIFQVATLVLIAARWLKLETNSPFLGALRWFMELFFRPLRVVTRRIASSFDLAPILFIVIILPLQFVIVYELRQMAQ